MPNPSVPRSHSPAPVMCAHHDTIAPIHTGCTHRYTLINKCNFQIFKNELERRQSLANHGPLLPCNCGAKHISMFAWDLEDRGFCTSGHLLECDRHVRSSPRVILRPSWQPFTPQCELYVCRAAMGKLVFFQHPLIHPPCPSNKSRICSRPVSHNPPASTSQVQDYKCDCLSP